MTSSFGWLDNDDDQRRRMIEIVELFRQPGTVDELGIGSIRDTLANTMFPGTSTLHTRLRYVLFIPWLMSRASSKGNPDAMVAELRELEFRLIASLMAAGENEGVLGNVAGRDLKRLPSVAYWSALGTWGLIEPGSSQAFFRRQSDIRNLARRAATADDPEARDVMPTWGFDPGIPSPPNDLMVQANFNLTHEDEDFLSTRIATATDGTLLSWLVRHPPGNVGPTFGDSGASAPWEISNLDKVDHGTRELIEHARRFSLLIHGAALVYNLALARKSRRDEPVERHEVALAAWQNEEAPAQTAADWNRDAFWALIRQRNPRLTTLTQAFVDDWVNVVAPGGDLRTSADAERLVTNRERQIKGPRARLLNQAALDNWSGSSGLGRLTYRWDVARSHLQDLYDAREGA